MQDDTTTDNLYGFPVFGRHPDEIDGYPLPDELAGQVHVALNTPDGGFASAHVDADVSPETLNALQAMVDAAYREIPRRKAKQQDRFHRAEIITRITRSRGASKMKAFVLDGINWWVMTDQGLYKEAGYASMHSWLAAPAQMIENVHGAELAIQVVGLFHKYFRIKSSLMHRIGWAKFQLITPTVEGLRSECLSAQAMVDAATKEHEGMVDNLRVSVDAGDVPPMTASIAVSESLRSLHELQQVADRIYTTSRLLAIQWLEKATKMSASQLRTEIYGDDPGDGITWETLASTPARVDELKNLSADDLRHLLGIDYLNDDQIVMIESRLKRQKSPE